MTHGYWRASALCAVVFCTVAASPALALPTMIRLGYTNCAACHIAPQGGGLLNDYGRAVDQAQSLRGGEYRPLEQPFLDAINLDGRLVQDIRVVLQRQARWVDGQAPVAVFRPRMSYRNALRLGKALRVSSMFTGETVSATRPTVSYEPPVRPGSVVINTALVHYRVGDTLEVAAGRDQLPTGINIPDLAVFVRSSNRLGYYDAPAQAKMFWWGKRHQISPFVFGPGGHEPAGDRETGAGTLAEFDVLGKQKAVLGVNVLHATAPNGDRRVLGGYARLGFGRWGVLAEHDVTVRTRAAQAATAFRQDATYAQVFWAVREWLVASAIGERLTVDVPYAQRVSAAKLDVSARLASQATLGFGARTERDMMTGRIVKSLFVQAAFKTVN